MLSQKQNDDVEERGTPQTVLWYVIVITLVAYNYLLQLRGRDAVLLRASETWKILSFFLQVSEAGFARAHGIHYRSCGMNELTASPIKWLNVSRLAICPFNIKYIFVLRYAVHFFRRAETSCSCCTECSGKCKHTQDHSQPDTTCNFSAVKVNLKEAFPSHLQQKHVARESNRSVLISRRRTQTTERCRRRKHNL